MSVGSVLISSPAVQALLLKILVNVLEVLFGKVDASKVAVKNAKYLKLLSAVLGVGVVVVNLAMAGHLADLNAADVINKLIEAFAGILVGGSVPVKNLTQGFAGRIKNGFK